MNIQYGMFGTLKLHLLTWLQKQCQHPSELVSTDISEGSSSLSISWCRLCGAVRINGSVHEPRANWWIEENSKARKRLLSMFPWTPGTSLPDYPGADITSDKWTQSGSDRRNLRDAIRYRWFRNSNAELAKIFSDVRFASGMWVRTGSKYVESALDSRIDKETGQDSFAEIPSPQQRAECDCSAIDSGNPTCIWPRCAKRDIAGT